MRLILIATSLASVALGEFTVNQNVLNTILALITIIGVVLAVIRYIENKIDHKIRNHSNIAIGRYNAVMREIQVIREIMALQKIPDSTEEDDETRAYKKKEGA